MAGVQKRRAVLAPTAGSVAPANPWNSGSVERRVNGLLRVPFVQRCVLDFDDGSRDDEAFLVNINVLGAYVARDQLPDLGQGVCCRFAVPGNERPLDLIGVVAWINARQQHPVHSLPPGFGLKFKDLTVEQRHRIEQVIEDYVARQPPR